MTLRVGRRWAWTAAGATSQRDSEEVRNFGLANDSLRDELADVLAYWRGAEPATGERHPATVREARRVTELCEQLYARID